MNAFSSAILVRTREHEKPTLIITYDESLPSGIEDEKILLYDALLKSPRESLRYPYIANALSPILAAYPHGER